MDDGLFPLVAFFGFFAAIVFFGVVLGRAAAKRTAAGMRQIGEGMGLTITQRPPSLGIFEAAPEVAGIYRGRPARLFTFTTGSGKSRQHWAAVGVRVAGNVRLGFSLEPQGFGTKVMEWFGQKEITFGDREFDDAWFVRADPPDTFRLALIPEVRRRFMEARRAGLRGAFRLEGGEVRYVERGTFGESGAPERHLRAAALCRDLADLTEVIGGA